MKRWIDVPSHTHTCNVDFEIIIIDGTEQSYLVRSTVSHYTVLLDLSQTPGGWRGLSNPTSLFVLDSPQARMESLRACVRLVCEVLILVCAATYQTSVRYRTAVPKDTQSLLLRSTYCEVER